MKPSHERNQECLPPKKRDLPVSSPCGGGGGDEGAPPLSSSSSGGESQGGGAPPGGWVQVQSAPQYSAESADGVTVPVDQYSMLYKVALPSVTYAPSSLHPVLGHISPAYTVPSPLLQHPGIPYPPLGYTQIPHSSLQFMASPYGVPYAVPPGFVPGPLISSQTPHVPHLIPYPSVIQEGMASPPPPQPPPSGHAFPKMATAGSVSLMLTPDQAAAAQQQVLGSLGGLVAPAEGSPRGASALYAHAGSRDVHRARQVNGGEEGESGRGQPLQDSVCPPHAVASSNSLQDGGPGARRYEETGSPGPRNTPDADREVRQVVCRQTSSPNQGVGGGRREESGGPLNLSQSSQRSWQALPAGCVENVVSLGKPVYEVHPAGPADPRVAIHREFGQPAHHAVMLANGQPVLVPLDCKQPQQQYTSLSNDAITTATAVLMKPSKAFNSPAQTLLPARGATEPGLQQQMLVQSSPAPSTLVRTQTPPPVTQNPSHFMKGAIIQLATGELKRVEDLQTQDFVRSAEVSGGLKIDSSMVVDIHRSAQKAGLATLHFTVGEQQSKVAIDVPLEHPFFVFGQGWSSCSPEGTAKLYGLACHPLQVGDVCVSIALQQLQRQEKMLPRQQLSGTPARGESAAGVIAQPMGPPITHQARSQVTGRAEVGHRDNGRGGEGDPVQVRGGGLGNTPSQPDRTVSEHPRSLSSDFLHTEGTPRSLATMRGSSSSIIGAQRHWSVPSFQRYRTKTEEEAGHSSSAGSTRPSFIPQEVKLSIEGRSNAGK